MATGKGVTQQTPIDSWEINDAGSPPPVALFSHAANPTIQSGANVFFSLPLDSAGMTAHVWLQGSVKGIVDLARPRGNMTKLAEVRLTERVNEVFVRLHALPKAQASAAITDLQKQFGDIRQAADNGSGRLTARSL
ncbi:hypothetical protein [Sphingomonas sp. MMS24-J13]|uniref:hypothetical protein n=1 Tax=Sphingomonas sp. MMS24-J13 TaxID=3238686 RepID=UPI0038503B47